MTTMRAARFPAASRALVLENVPVPAPGPGEVLVRVRACGICLSDVHLLDGTLPTSLPVVTPGHEAAGVLEHERARRGVEARRAHRRHGETVPFRRCGTPSVIHDAAGAPFR